MKISLILHLIILSLYLLISGCDSNEGTKNTINNDNNLQENCWDKDSDGIKDSDEDINKDNFWDTKDCIIENNFNNEIQPNSQINNNPNNANNNLNSNHINSIINNDQNSNTGNQTNSNLNNETNNSNNIENNNNNSTNNTNNNVSNSGNFSNNLNNAVNANPEPDFAWDAPGEFDGSAFKWGVQTGDATINSVLVSLRTTLPEVSIILVKGDASNWEQINIIENLIPVEGVIKTEISELQADTAYSIAVYSYDFTARSRVVRFRTALAPNTNRIIRFGSTSGLGGNWPWDNLTRASEEKLDFFVLLGDTIYADWGENVGFIEKWKEALSTQGLNDVAASTSFVATWDDHEVANNWSYNTSGMEQKAAEGKAAYLQAIPQRIGPGGTGLWRKLSWGKTADLFILDSRGERRDGNYISEEQMDWLKSGLLESKSRFKFIMNSVPILDFSAMVGNYMADDRWQGFPEQRSEIVEFISNNDIQGILWLTGDFHLGGVGKVDASGGPGDNQWEVLTGPSGSSINPAARMFNENERIPIIVGQFNYTYFEANPENGNVIVKFIADDGSIISEMVLAL